MARRKSKGVIDALELWARWCEQGGTLYSSGRTMLAKLIDNKGEIFFGGGGASEPADCLESRIESLVLAMFAKDPIRADVLRLECCAGARLVAQRRGIRNFSPWGIGRFEKADALGISLRTYERRLREALDIIELELGAV